jgi:hypothetical protein
VAGLLLDDRHDLGRLVTDHGEQRGEVRAGDAVQPVDGERLPDAAVQRSGAQPLEPVRDGGMELERHAQRRGEGREVAPRLADGGGGVADAGEPQRGRAAGARRQRLQERRSLVALQNVEVHDVDAVLVGREVRKLDVGAGLVQDLVDLERLRRRWDDRIPASMGR